MRTENQRKDFHRSLSSGRDELPNYGCSRLSGETHGGEILDKNDKRQQAISVRAHRPR
jgi:hypothetical protein